MLNFRAYVVQNVHQGYMRESLVRFLKARDWNVSKAHKMVGSLIVYKLYVLLIL